MIACVHQSQRARTLIFKALKGRSFLSCLYSWVQGPNLHCPRLFLLMTWSAHRKLWTRGHHRSCSAIPKSSEPSLRFSLPLQPDLCKRGPVSTCRKENTFLLCRFLLQMMLKTQNLHFHTSGSGLSSFCPELFPCGNEINDLNKNECQNPPHWGRIIPGASMREGWLNSVNCKI